MDATRLQEFGRKYTTAWCSQKPASVAAFFTENGSLTINDGTPAVGRTAITAAAQSFMTAFPDMVVAMDRVGVEGNRPVYRWTLTGTNTGPGGTGKVVRISGFEEWTFDANGLIAESKGHFDEAEYNRELRKGPQPRVGRTIFECASPILSVSDMTRSLRYYVDVLGFANAEWGGDHFTCVSRDNASIYLSKGDQGQPGTWVWLGVEDVDDLYKEYQMTGATILDSPRNFPWAREMRVGDPDGHVLRFGSDPVANVEAGA